MRWLDDMLLFEAVKDEPLSRVQELLKYCTDRHINLHPRKRVLYTEETRWCRRLISNAGIKLDPSRMNGYLNIEPPVNGADLQQFLCEIQ